MNSSSRCKTGFIGYGSMGSMLVDTFLRTGALTPDQIIISTRDRSRCSTLLQDFPAVTLADDNRDLVQKSPRAILGVKPLDILPVIRECADLLGQQHHLISLAGCVQIHASKRSSAGRLPVSCPVWSIAAVPGVSSVVIIH